MPLKLGKQLKQKHRLTAKDFQLSPIWLTPLGVYDETVRPVTSRDPDVSTQLLKETVFPQIMLTVAEMPGVVAWGQYDRRFKHCSNVRFWSKGRWVELKEMPRNPRPLTLVAVAKIRGTPGVKFYVPTSEDDYAVQMGGTYWRWKPRPRKLILTRGMVAKIAPTEPEPKTTLKDLPRLTGAKLGKAVEGWRVSLRQRIKNPIWIDAPEEDGLDESAQRPVISRRPTVSAELVRKLGNPTITFKVAGTSLHGMGSYDRKSDSLGDLTFFVGKARPRAYGLKGASAPLVLEPLCQIMGTKFPRFTLKSLNQRRAKRSGE